MTSTENFNLPEKAESFTDSRMENLREDHKIQLLLAMKMNMRLCEWIEKHGEKFRELREKGNHNIEAIRQQL